MSEKKENLALKFKNHVAEIIFSNEKSNALSIDLLKKMSEMFQKLSEDTKIKVIVLKSEGAKIFCAGACFEELLAIQNIKESLTFFSGFADLILAMRNCKKIIIGNIQGKSVGGALGIIAACDYVFATEHSEIKLSELWIGLGPFVIAPAIIRKIGENAFAKLSFNPQNFQNSRWAKEHYLYTEVFSDEKILEEKLKLFTENFENYHLEALENLKKILWKKTEHWKKELFENAKITAKLALSETTQKRIQNFKKK